MFATMLGFRHGNGKLIGPLVALGLCATIQAQTVRHVDDNASLGGDGLSWDTPYRYLQDALFEAAGDPTITEIRVAQGTYEPDRNADNPGGTGDRGISFQLLNGITIEGGYAGLSNPDDPDARDPELYETTLSGDLDRDDVPEIFLNYDENSIHVVSADDTTTAAVLDGLVVRGGNANDHPTEPQGGGIHNVDGGLTVVNCRLHANQADKGGAIYSTGDLALTNCVIERNRAISTSASGAGVFCTGDGSAIVTLTDCTVQNNTCQGYSNRGVGVSSIQILSLTLSNCMVRGNSNDAGDNRGNGMYTELVGTVILDGCTFADNTHTAGTTWGGGVYNLTVGSLTVQGCVFERNMASTGGGVYNAAVGNLAMVDCTFTANSTSGYAGAAGGAMANHGLVSGAASIFHCFFIRNGTDSGRGGALYNENSSPTLMDCYFDANSANGHSGNELGGAVANRDGSDPLIVRCLFLGNSCSNAGGALVNESSSPWVINCSFLGNVTGSDRGGAVGNRLDSEPLFVNCLFSGNAAEIHGGAIYNSGNPTLVSCTLSANAAGGSGGGVYNDAGMANLSNCIIWGNRDDGGTNEEAQIYRLGGDVIINYSCVQGWTGQFGGEGNIDNDPLFTDADGLDDVWGTEDDNLRLWAGSRCIDAADNRAVPPDIADLDDDQDASEPTPRDLDENARFTEDPLSQDTGVLDPDNPGLPITDMGAYEFQPDDCNNNSIPDSCDIDCDLPGCERFPNCDELPDVNGNGIPDECDPDCDGDGLPDDYEIDNCPPEDPDCQDCNGNQVPDECDIADGYDTDCQGNGTPDQCELDPDYNTGPVQSIWTGGIDNDNWNCGPPEDDDCGPVWCPNWVPDNGDGRTFSVEVNNLSAVITLDRSPTIDELTLEGDGQSHATIVVNDASGAAIRSLAVITGIVNSGILQATDGNRFVLDAPQIDQTGGGTLLAKDGDATSEQLSILEINGAYVTGGYARTDGIYSEIHLIGGAVLDGVEIDGVVVPDGQIGAFAGTIVNNGTLGIAPDGREVTMFIPASDQAILSGQGASVELGGELVAWLGSFSKSFTNASGHTIEGTGVVFGGFVNDGTIEANREGAALIISTPGQKTNTSQGTLRANGNTAVLSIESPLDNDGKLEALAGGMIQIRESVTGNGYLLAEGGRIQIIDVGAPDGVYADDVDVLPGSMSYLDVTASDLDVTYNMNITGGEATLTDGSDVVVGGTVTICPDTNADPDAVAVLKVQDSVITAASFDVCEDGVIRGNGTIGGDVLNNAGYVVPGESAAILSILGNYTQSAAGSLDIEIGGLDAGSEFDVLEVSNTVTLAGTLTVNLINGFQPQRGNSFTIVTGSVVQGQFDTLDLPTLGNELAWSVEYLVDNVTLRVVRDATPGPFDLLGPLDPIDIRRFP